MTPLLILTGASRGIGRAIAERALERGFVVGALARNAGARPIGTLLFDEKACIAEVAEVAVDRRDGQSKLCGQLVDACLAAFDDDREDRERTAERGLRFCGGHIFSI